MLYAAVSTMKGSKGSPKSSGTRLFVRTPRNVLSPLFSAGSAASAPPRPRVAELSIRGSVAFEGATVALLGTHPGDLPPLTVPLLKLVHKLIFRFRLLDLALLFALII